MTNPIMTDIPESLSGSAAEPVRRPRRWRGLVVAGLIAVCVTLYYGISTFFAYTEDAYVRSDLVSIAPQVAGTIQAVSVQDNERVKVGDPIATIDPRSYLLDVSLKTERVASLQAVVAVKSQQQAADMASRDAANSALEFAQREFDRFKALLGDQVVAQERFDKASNDLRAAQDLVTVRQTRMLVNAREVDAAKAEVEVARAELAVSQYALDRTRLTAPVGGYVNNLNLRPGDYASVGDAVVGIVDDSRWRVIANFKEDVAASVKSGTPVWVWLDSDPWRLHAGRVQGVGRGIAREQAPGELLPYVAPTTDWIRLRRRFPVTILLDPPMPAQGLLMGADARVFFKR